MKRIFLMIGFTLLFCLLFLGSSFALTKEEAASVLKEMILGEFKVLAVKEAPLEGFWEVVAEVGQGHEKTIVYIDNKNLRFVFHGQILDRQTKKNITLERLKELRMVDVGTGSGCIALALAKELPNAEIHATDISAAALEIARANAARLQLEKRVQFHQADLLENLRSPFYLVVSNPPYVGESEEDQVQLEVRKFEPRTAVFAGPIGTEVIARLIPQALERLRPGGWIILEISGTIVNRVRELLIGWNDLQVVADLQSIPRIVFARKPLA